jgi:hypothetical protein
MYKKELKALHERITRLNAENSDLMSKLNLIRDVDYYKSEMLRMVHGNKNIPYKVIASDPRYKYELEDLFELPFNEIKNYYTKLLYERNDLVHYYTRSHWVIN